MPTILSLKQSPGTLPSNPGEAELSPASFGAAEDALARLGQIGSEIGNSYVEASSRAQEADFVMNQSIENAKSIEEKKKQIQQEYMVDDGFGFLRFDPRGKPVRDDITGDMIYPESYSKKVEKLTREQIDLGLNNMPNERARRSYMQSSDNVLFKEVNESLNFEQTELTKFILQNKDKYQVQSAQNVRDNPTLDNLSARTADMTKYFSENKNYLYNPSKAVDEYKKSIRNIIQEGYFEGMLEKDPEKGLAVLNAIGTPSGNGPKDISVGVFGNGGSVSEMANFLTAQDVNNLKDKFQAKIKEKSYVEVYNLENELRDMKAASMSGINSGGLTRGAAIIERQDQLKAFRSKEDKVRAYSDMISSVVIGQAKSRIAATPNADIAGIMKNSEALYANELKKVSEREGINIPKEFAFGDKVELQAKVGAAINEVLKERQKNPANAVIEGNKTIEKMYNESSGGLSAVKEMNEAYFSQNIQEQTRLGIANTRPLKSEDAKALAAQIVTSNPADGMNDLWGLREKTGKYFDKVMNQLVTDGKLPEYYQVASYADSKEAAFSIINGMKNKGSFKTVLKEGGEQYKESDVRSYVNDEFNDYYQSMIKGSMDGGNLKLANSLREAAYYETANLISRGVKVDEAASKAVDTVIRNTTNVYNGAMVPVKNFERSKLSMDYVSTDEFAIANTDKLVLGGIENLRRSDISDYEWNREKTQRVKMALQDPNGHTWINKQDGSGAVLNFRIKEPNNPLGFKLVPARTNDGGKVEIDWSDGKLKVGKER